MTIHFPSPEFDEVVAAVCHGSASEDQMRALNDLLRRDGRARDEYLIRLELHNYLASEPGLFSPTSASHVAPLMPASAKSRARPLAFAACIILLAAGASLAWLKLAAGRRGATSRAVAMLARTVNARWAKGQEAPRAGGALEPGWLHLEGGLAQIVFYSGARVVIEGPTDLQILSQNEAICPLGRVLAEAPEQARGFRVKTGQINVVDLGTAFGIEASGGQSEVDVFKGEVELSAKGVAAQPLRQGGAACVAGGRAARFMAARRDDFTNMLEFQQRSLAAETLRYDQWRLKSAELDQDSSLVARFDFEGLGESESTLRNRAQRSGSVSDGAIIGCQPAQGRWREKQALEFQSVNDRVRFAAPGDFESLTLSAWVCVKGLDRQFNSLVMSDGFDGGTIHWLIRNDGVLGLTVFGAGRNEFQILTSPPVIGVENLGTWLQLAVVLNGQTGEATQYLNGLPVSRRALKIAPPFRISSAELGNWNARRDSGSEPSLIRNLSGSIDEFELFSRGLSDAEVWDLYTEGKPDL